MHAKQLELLIVTNNGFLAFAFVINWPPTHNTWRHRFNVLDYNWRHIILLIDVFKRIDGACEILRRSWNSNQIAKQNKRVRWPHKIKTLDGSAWDITLCVVLSLSHLHVHVHECGTWQRRTSLWTLTPWRYKTETGKYFISHARICM